MRSRHRVRREDVFKPPPNKIPCKLEQAACFHYSLGERPSYSSLCRGVPVMLQRGLLSTFWSVTIRVSRHNKALSLLPLFTQQLRFRIIIPSEILRTSPCLEPACQTFQCVSLRPLTHPHPAPKRLPPRSAFNTLTQFPIIKMDSIQRPASLRVD